MFGGEFIGIFGLDALTVPTLPRVVDGGICTAAEQMDTLTVKPPIGKTP